jgi:hypothetical protein
MFLKSGLRWKTGSQLFPIWKAKSLFLSSAFLANMPSNSNLFSRLPDYFDWHSETFDLVT